MPPGTSRFALRLEYDGSCFHGFQVQPPGHGVTVQGELERHLESITNAPTRIVCAGRTDTGVHATSQIVHFDCAAERPLRAWTRGLDRKLPKGVGVRHAQVVQPHFHARFSALQRRYCYVIEDGCGHGAAIGNEQVLRTAAVLDADAMHRAAGHLAGEHDFSSFRAAGCQAASPIRTISSIDVRRLGNLLVLDVCANAFLQHMVRNIVGALTAVGVGEVRADQLAALLAARDRTLAPPTAPPDGLYLVDVCYPPEFGLPAGPFWPPLLRAAGRVDGGDPADRAPQG